MPFKQVYDYTRSGNTNTWTPIESGDFAWTTETEEEYLTKLGFDATKYYYNDPLFMTNYPDVHNKLFRMIIFLEKSDTPPIANSYTTVCYVRIKDKSQGVMFLITHIGDLVFLLDAISEGVSMPFQPSM